MIQKWLAERGFDWATLGRSAELAVWHQALMDESVAARGLTSATAFLDLAKAFENVRLEDVWCSGRHCGFPPTVLRMALGSFAFLRRLCLHRAARDPAATLSATLAGGGFAQTALILVLTHPLELLSRRQVGSSVTMDVCMYVDDIAIHLIGGLNEETGALAQTAEWLIDYLESRLKMQVSRRQRWASEGNGKTVVTPSSKAAVQRLSTPMRRLGVQMRCKAKHLGVVFAPGARRKQGLVMHSRWIDNAKKAARTTRLGRRL